MRVDPGAGRGASFPVSPQSRVTRVAGAGASPAEALRTNQNHTILSASLEVSLRSGNDSLSLVFKTSIENLNETLAPALGPDAIRTGYASGLDVSPEATAGRIVSLSTALFDRYLESNPDKAFGTALQDFVELIRGGIEQGFAEAREILDGLGVLQGDLASNVDKTFELVQQGLQAFLDRLSERPDDTTQPPAAPAA
jgi:hypothetical protein